MTLVSVGSHSELSNTPRKNEKINTFAFPPSRRCRFHPSFVNNQEKRDEFLRELGPYLPIDLYKSNFWVSELGVRLVNEMKGQLPLGRPYTRSTATCFQDESLARLPARHKMPDGRSIPEMILAAGRFVRGCDGMLGCPRAQYFTSSR